MRISSGDLSSLSRSIGGRAYSSPSQLLSLCWLVGVDCTRFLMLADLCQLKGSAEELVKWGEPQVSGEFVERNQGGDSVVLTSPQLPLLIPELNEADCIFVQI